MRRTLLLLATMMFALVVAGRVALAATVTCSGDPECVGTDENDRIKGSNNDEHIFGFGGSDIIDGNGGSDHVVGDRLASGEPTTTPDGDDKLDGGPDADRVYGYGGSDTLIGSQGADYIDAVSYETFGSSNTIKAGLGDDEISANNGVYDRIDCGTGGELFGDSAQVDLNGLDNVAKNCERVDPLQVPTSG
jgi:Ca2+-binding RTX toxin-like protein